MLNSLPDRTFVFGLIALILAIAAFAYLALWPSIEIVETNVEGVAESRRVGIAEANGVVGLVISGIPVLITLGAILSLPPSGNTERRHKLNLVVGTIILWGFIVMFSGQIGILFAPAGAMLISVLVLTFVRPRAWGNPEARQRSKSARALRDEAVRRNERSGNRVGKRPVSKRRRH